MQRLLPSHPIDTLQDILEERNMSVKDLAYATRFPIPYVEELLKKHLPLEDAFIEALESAGISTKGFWTRRRDNYYRDCEVNTSKSGKHD